MQYPTLIHKNVALAKENQNPTVICKMPSGWAVLGDSQFLPGYCLLLADPVVPSLNEMDPAHRSHFMSDMALIGDALLECTWDATESIMRFWQKEPALHLTSFPVIFLNRQISFKSLSGNIRRSFANPPESTTPAISLS